MLEAKHRMPWQSGYCGRLESFSRGTGAPVRIGQASTLFYSSWVRKDPFYFFDLGYKKKGAVTVISAVSLTSAVQRERGRATEQRENIPK